MYGYCKNQNQTTKQLKKILMDSNVSICDYCKQVMSKHVSLYDWDTHKYHRVHYKCWRKATADYWMYKELHNNDKKTNLTRVD